MMLSHREADLLDRLERTKAKTFRIVYAPTNESFTANNKKYTWYKFDVPKSFFPVHPDAMPLLAIEYKDAVGDGYNIQGYEVLRERLKNINGKEYKISGTRFAPYGAPVPDLFFIEGFINAVV